MIVFKLFQLILQFAKVTIFIGLEMKKNAFLLFFLLLSFLSFSQSIDYHKTNDEKVHYVLVETDMGNMTVMLYNETPQHRDNFLKLVNAGFYDGLLFHRVIKNFMIQGGDPESKDAKPGQMLGNGTLGYYVPAEFVEGIIHKKGALAAARDNNPQKASSSCQFYIVQGNVWDSVRLDQMGPRMGKKFSSYQKQVYATVGGTPHLDGDYTVFGEVIEGLEVIDKIATVLTGLADRPIEDVKMRMREIER